MVWKDHVERNVEAAQVYLNHQFSSADVCVGDFLFSVSVSSILSQGR